MTTARLAIELDGGTHDLTKEEDAERDRVFSQLGWRVLRLPNQFAFAPDQLVDAVRAAVRDEEPKLTPAKDWLADR